MDLIIYLHNVVDDILMSFFRYPESPVTGFLLGTAVLSLISVCIGEVSMYLSFRWNKQKIVQTSLDMGHYHALSISALKTDNEKAYKACNSIANESYGKSFFLQITLVAASFWPVLLALGWMQYRFEHVQFSITLSSLNTEYSSGYFSIFALCYLMVRLAYIKIKHLLLPHSAYNNKNNISD